MKIHSSIDKDFNSKKKLISDDGKIRFNNRKSKIDAKGKKKSSQKWLSRQINDPYTSAARIEGYLARSAYKLLEIQKKYNVFEKHINTIIDLGCSPGSWSQVVLTDKRFIGKQIIGVDLLPIKFEHPNLFFIQGDFEDKEVQDKILSTLKEITKNNKTNKADCIMCDIALNNIGDKEIDRIRCERIVETALYFCRLNLVKNGHFICKTLKGADNTLFKDIKNDFKFVHRFKPNASRKDSSEIFLVCLCKK